MNYKVELVIAKLNGEVMKGTTLKAFAEKNDLGFKSVDAFHNSMNRLHREVLASVVVGAKTFFPKLVASLGMDMGDLQADGVGFPIPYSFARALSYLPKDDQVKFVRKWKLGNLSLTEKEINEFAKTANSSDFDTAYRLVIEGSPGRSLETTTVVLTHALARGSLAPAAFASYGYSKEEVEKAISQLARAGLLSCPPNGSVYELTDRALEIYARVWQELPEQSLAGWVATQLTAIGALRVGANGARTKRILKAIRSQLDYTEKAADSQLSFDRLVAK